MCAEARRDSRTGVYVKDYDAKYERPFQEVRGLISGKSRSSSNDYGLSLIQTSSPVNGTSFIELARPPPSRLLPTSKPVGEDISTTSEPDDISTTSEPDDISTTSEPEDISTTSEPDDISTTTA